ncbi:TRAP-type C4-dicarboxylate transport system periplasmic component [Desulfocucumis palustris]|uniref:TRAP-type C4-dicarboxylate transport system periplasmic component n=1 Tax=Desulfocucumis palustris TaxID=1898651 RepID=A0A2L2XNN5_9FIRM|nr:TRAP transporter substrate-binding protein [Desulfocucumis palustris]GBF35581.1 TRAP-type C4-dicarboxylate transport system periplasmic component [Desulfocucumis palustris]
MKIFRNKPLLILLAVVMAAALTGCGGGGGGEKAPSGDSAKKITVKFSHVVAETTPKGQAAIKFKEELEKSGQFEVQLFPSSQLYGDKEELEALKANNVQLIAPSVTKLVGFVPAFQLVDMPFLFASDQAAYNFYDGPKGQELMNSLEPQGMLGLGWWPNGSKHFTNSKKPLKKPEDFKGLKFRTQSGGVLDEQFKSLGAGSQTIAFGEVYQALNNKTVDGQENTFNNIDTQKYAEVQKYMTISAHGRLDYVVLTNTTFWNSLNDEQKKLFTDAMNTASQLERQMADELNAKSFETLKNSGKMEIYTLTEEDRQAFIKALQPVYDKYTEAIGKDYIEAARNSK